MSDIVVETKEDSAKDDSIEMPPPPPHPSPSPTAAKDDTTTEEESESPDPNKIMYHGRGRGKENERDGTFLFEALDAEEPQSDEIDADYEFVRNHPPTTELEKVLTRVLARKTQHAARLGQEMQKVKEFISKRKQTYKRKRKLDGAPTRALSAYNIFIKDRFAQLAKENEEALKSDNKDAKLLRVPSANLVAETGNMWKDLPAEEKAKSNAMESARLENELELTQNEVAKEQKAAQQAAKEAEEQIGSLKSELKEVKEEAQEAFDKLARIEAERSAEEARQNAIKAEISRKAEKKQRGLLANRLDRV